ncbi:transporter [Lithospermum erythrorhizon]|uniref:Transporter n=1 Tax=Lithospermum erythrorhizon TaxID=34254 RepID=A0AAV3PC05_LITER
MAAELVNAATGEKLTEIDWTKNIEICELVASDHRQTKDVIKAIKKRLGSKNGNTQLLAASLLEMLMNNIGEPVHKQIIDMRIIPILVKIVKTKQSELPVREKIFLLLDAAQTSVGGASGKFPQYYNAYYELVTAGVQFPQRVVQPTTNGVHSRPPAKEQTAPQPEKRASEVEGLKASDPSILERAGTALEVLREVLAAVDTRHPEAAKDEFTLDLVEQCSFHKQKVMQLAMTSRDDKLVSQAIDMNEQLQKVLRKHDALVSTEPAPISNHLTNHLTQDQEEDEQEEEPEQLFRRYVRLHYLNV